MSSINPYQAPQYAELDPADGLPLTHELLEAILDAEDLMGMILGGMAGILGGLLLAALFGETEPIELFLWGDYGYVAGNLTGGILGGVIRFSRWWTGRARDASPISQEQVRPV